MGADSDLNVTIVEDPADADTMVYVVNQQVVAGSPAAGDVPVVQGDGSLAWGAGGGGAFTPSFIGVGNNVVAMPAASNGLANAWSFIDGLRGAGGQVVFNDTLDNPFGDAFTFEEWAGSADYPGPGAMHGGFDVLVHEAGVYELLIHYQLSGALVVNTAAGAAPLPYWDLDAYGSHTQDPLPMSQANGVFETVRTLLVPPDLAVLPFPLGWWGTADVSIFGVDNIAFGDLALFVTKVA